MSRVLVFERRERRALRTQNVFRQLGHQVHRSEPMGANRIAESVLRVRPRLVTTCWDGAGDMLTIKGVRRADQRVPIWVISDEPDHEIAMQVTSVELIIPARFPELLRDVIVRELGIIKTGVLE